MSANIFPNKLAPSVPINILRNPPSCSFASSFIVSLTPFNSIPESSRDLKCQKMSIFKMPFISSFQIIKVVVPDPRIFLFIAAFVADAAVVIPSTTKASITIFNNGSPDFNNGAKNIENPPFRILVNCVYDNLISVDEWLAKTLQRFVPCLLVNNNL